MWRKAKGWCLPVLASGMAMFALYHLLFADQPRPKLTPPTPPPESAAEVLVAGVGVAEPCSESISVGAAQTGIVLELLHGPDDVGKRVARGEPLFRVDDRALRAQLGVHQAKLAAAQAALAKLKQMPRQEDIPPWEAKVLVAQSRARDLHQRYLRARQISGKAISDEEITQRQFAWEAAQHQLAQAQRELDLLRAGAWQPDLDIARAAVNEAKANIEYIETEIERCLVRAPIDGEILQVGVRVGEFVHNASASDLFVLGDLSHWHVRVDIDEEDIPRFDRTAPARAVVRGDTARSYRLSLERIEPMVVPKRTLTGDNTERVDTRVLQAVYRIDSPDQRLLVGQQLDVFLEASGDAVTEPNSAELTLVGQASSLPAKSRR